jgi:H+/Cl- antiporter ClcA
MLRSVQVIERTAKRWKIVIFVGILCTLFGGFLLWLSFATNIDPHPVSKNIPVPAFRLVAIYIFSFGVIEYTLGHACAWWEHG